MMKNRAVARFEIKSIDEDAREFSGWASTPSVDLQGDRISPTGAVYTLPLPLLAAHDSAQPIGHVTAARVTTAGISIDARIAKVSEPPALRDRLSIAWAEIKSGLTRGLSIGFRILESEPIAGGEYIKSWLWLELSTVVIAANQSATITAIRSADLRSTRGSVSSTSQRELLARMAARLDPRVAEVRRARLLRDRRLVRPDPVYLQLFGLD